MHNHNHDCKHEYIEFCAKCDKPYCRECGKEWEEKCMLSHYLGYSPQWGYDYAYPGTINIPYCVPDYTTCEPIPYTTTISYAHTS